MVEAVKAMWGGGNYQARIFWENAFNLLSPDSCVVEVTFEANGPRAFDDVVVKYDPPIPRSGPDRVSADYHQVKWHVHAGHRFGYEDLIDPEFIGAATFSLLQRLRDARTKAERTAHFILHTNARIRDDDPLSELVSSYDNTLIMDSLFDGTTNASRMGRVRKLWRDHLETDDDQKLRDIIGGLRLIEDPRSLDEIRTAVNGRARAVGLVSYPADTSDFRYDELARQLKTRGINGFNKKTFHEFCVDEHLFFEADRRSPDGFLSIAILGFLGRTADIVGATPDNTLILLDDFRQRYLRDGRDWQRDIRPKVETFLRDAKRKCDKLHLIMDAHASIAFLAGTVLDLKSGAEIRLVQNGRDGRQVWRANDGAARADARFQVVDERLGSGAEIAVAISPTHSVTSRAKDYIATHLPGVGQMIDFGFPTGPGQQTVAGGQHAAALADQVSNHISATKSDPDDKVHIFAACPNSLMFYLGQNHQGIAPCVVYEYDFDRKGNRTYQPSFLID